MLITFYDSYVVLGKVYNGEFLKQALNGTQIRTETRAKTTKICYGVLDKDITLEYILNILCQKQPKTSIKTILKIGLYSIIYLENKPFAVTDACVELTKKLGKGGASGFVNAVLRNYLRRKDEFNFENFKDLSVKYSYPEFIVKKLISGYGKETAEEILKADTERTFIRFNTGIDGEKYLTEKGINYEKTPFYNSFIANGFKMDEDFYNGIYTFQSVGSVAICSMIEGGENLFDACSAPGGKAVLLADKFKSVTANELHAHRVELIKSYASRMNKQNITAVNGDATVYNDNYANKYDAVLCDVPCSGTGVIKDNPDIKLNRTEKSITELNETQLKLLENLKNYVKKGGNLYYSTCSVLREENDKIIKKFLENNKDFVEEKTTCILNGISLEYGTQFLPNISLGAGFYFCKLKRL